MKCINCLDTNGYHIADGLYLCRDCEKNDKFCLVCNRLTKAIYWTNVDWITADEELIFKDEE